jgi:hypothetical protein
VTIKLSIAGLGYFHALPVGMWDGGGERQLGTRQILEVLDDPLEKARHWVREGARIFDLQPDNLDACSRWIALFGLTPSDWPPESLYNLALILPSMQEIAATGKGIGMIFRLLLGVAVKEIHYFSTFRQLPEQGYSLLGDRFGRLGVDSILGDHIGDLDGMRITVGPISLEDYYRFQGREKKRLVSMVLDLCISSERKCCISWLVENPETAPRLGFEEENSRLGINSHLGRQKTVGVQGEYGFGRP